MTKYYFKSIRSQSVTELETPKPGTWVHVESPSVEEVDHLIAQFNLEPGHVQDALDKDEVPRLEREGEVTYIFVRFAYKASDGTMDTAPLLIVFDKEALITISPVHLPVVDLLLKGRTPFAFATTQKAKLTLLILSHVSDQYDNFINHTSRQIKAIRSRLRGQGLANQDLIDFVTIEDELNEFLSSLLPTNATLRRLLVGRHIPLFEEDQDIVEDLLLNNEQSIEAIRSNLRSIGNIRDAYSAIATNNLNRIITLLTAATILVALPNVVFSFYGMNVPLPFQESRWTFEFIIAANALLLVTLVVLARKKRII